MNYYNVIFNGYRLDDSRTELPNYGGVYMVYCCKPYEEIKKVSLTKLIYIGKAINIRDRICNHDRRSDFEKELKEGETLCYSYSSVSPYEIDVVENALINKQKPVLNEELKDTFNHPDSLFNIEGACGLLKEKHFIIKSTIGYGNY